MSAAAALRVIARALGGDVVGRQVIAPGPRHSPHDRSLSIAISLAALEGFVVFSHAGDDWRDCRDYVLQHLGHARNGRQQLVDTPNPKVAAHDKKRRAADLWAESVEPFGTLVEQYLTSRRLNLTRDLASAVRFHAHCPWKDEETGDVLRLPAMLAVMRNVVTDEITAVHRTVLSADGKKIGRRMLGAAAGAAVKLDGDDAVTMGLTIGEGIETCLAARQLGFRPPWAMGSVGGIATFPVLAGIESLTILCEADRASRRAADRCAARWHAAGKEVLFVRPRFGSDLNDAIQAA